MVLCTLPSYLSGELVLLNRSSGPHFTLFFQIQQTCGFDGGSGGISGVRVLAQCDVFFKEFSRVFGSGSINISCALVL